MKFELNSDIILIFQISTLLQVQGRCSEEIPEVEEETEDEVEAETEVEVEVTSEEEGEEVNLPALKPGVVISPGLTVPTT